MPDLNDLEDEHRALQEMHDVEHRKEQLLDRLEMFTEAASLPSQHFIRCDPSEGGCGASFRKDLDACPICTWSPECTCDHPDFGHVCDFHDNAP